jgi:hypothetical protein
MPHRASRVFGVETRRQAAEGFTIEVELARLNVGCWRYRAAFAENLANDGYFSQRAVRSESAM